MVVEELSVGDGVMSRCLESDPVVCIVVSLVVGDGIVIRASPLEEYSMRVVVGLAIVYIIVRTLAYEYSVIVVVGFAVDDDIVLGSLSDIYSGSAIVVGLDIVDRIVHGCYEIYPVFVLEVRCASGSCSVESNIIEDDVSFAVRIEVSGRRSDGSREDGACRSVAYDGAAVLHVYRRGTGRYHSGHDVDGVRR